MRRRRPLPPPLALAPFAVQDAFGAQVTERRLRDPSLERPFHGTRAVRQQPPVVESPRAREQRELLFQCTACTARMGPTDYFSHRTAARMWGCPLSDWFVVSEPLDVSRPGRAIRAAGIRGHNGANAVIVMRRGFQVSDPASTWLALAAELTLDELVAIGDHLVLDPRVLDPRDVRPYATADELRARLHDFHGRGARRASAALELIRQGAESRPETLVRLLLLRAGFPEPVLQAEIRDERGQLLGYADLYWPDLRIVVEYDGQHHRTDDDAYDRDITRIDDFISAGNRVVRIRKQGLFSAPHAEVARVEKAFRERGWA